jgi:hypothetical protein
LGIGSLGQTIHGQRDEFADYGMNHAALESDSLAQRTRMGE